MTGLVRCRSGYSFYRGTMRIAELANAAAGMGWNALALTDTDGIYGAVWFDRFAREAGLRPIIGAEVSGAAGESAVVLAKDADGYRRLCRILSARHLDESFSLRRTLAEPHPGIVVMTDSESLAIHLAKIPDIDLYFIVAPHRIFAAGRFAKSRGIKPVAANAIHYLKKSDRPLHKLLRAMEQRAAFSRILDSELAPDPAWMPTPGEFCRWYRAMPEALRNLDEVVEKCAMPSPPWGQTVLFDFSSIGGEDTFAALDSKVRDGARRRYGAITPEVNRRLESELDLVRRKGFASYFLVIEDIVRKFPITCGRGSAAASIVAYCLFITHVDPVRHNLLFERFLSPGRKDPPDIDVDFPWDERDGVLDYVFGLYGPERTAMVANHLSFQSRGAVRGIARAFGIPENEISAVTKRMRSFFDSLASPEEMRADPMFRGIEFDPPWDRIVRAAMRLEDLPYGLSVHCGGVVIADSLKDRVPLQTAVKGVNIIQWEKDQTEDAGLIKLDLLGNRSLAVIRDSLRDVAHDFGDAPSYSALNPLDDPATKRLIARGDTMGVFYIESPATRQLQTKAGAGDFEHVVIHSSIIRPAAHRFINEYVRRLRGEPWQSVHPAFDRILEETYGIMVYQEDVMKVAVGMAGFSFEEASELRRVLGKKHREKKLEDFRRRFFSGVREKYALDDARAREIWDMILSFAGYSFCKPHSASYALISFKSAWLRAHYPAYFMAGAISNEGGYYSTYAYLSETRRMGIDILPPDINASEWRHKAETPRAIRFGLMHICGLEKKLAERIVAERERYGRFEDMAEFMHRVAPPPEQARLLVRAGCFDGIDGVERRSALLWTVNAWEKIKSDRQPGLFKISVSPPHKLKPFDAAALIDHELQAFGFLLTRHPLDLYDMPPDVSHAREIGNCVGRRIDVAGWYIAHKHVLTESDEVMQFATFEDETALYETVIFPDAYNRYCHLLRTHRAFLIGGLVSEEQGAISLQVETLRPLRKTVSQVSLAATAG